VSKTPAQSVPPHSPFRSGSAGDEALVVRLAEEMAQAWRNGERPRVEHFLDRHPGLWRLPAAIVDLLYEEICLRLEHGAKVDRQEFVERFPNEGEQIDVLLRCARALEGPADADLPRAGETFGDFPLLSEIGRSGSRRVFVATQASLGHRPVVLKITPRRGDEHLALARLQHTHIVPLLSVHDKADRAVRILCMPYFGGLSLGEILARLNRQSDAPRARERRTGRQILELLDRARADAPVPLPLGQSPARRFLEGATYVQAVCWVGGCLAEALDYAHQRGLVHLDVKPSNVLLTADGQPMLLDFHLANQPLRPGDPGARFGGTPAYMSPEQHRAMAALQDGGTIPEAIDGRSDVYSLGLVLYKALGGFPAAGEASLAADERQPTALPPRPAPFTYPLNRCHPQVPVGLSDIVAKCLAPDAGDRYQDARALADDLWRHLNDLPLRGVPNRSFRERWRKWRRRKPHLLPLLAMLAAVLVVAAGALAIAVGQVRQRTDDARGALADGQRLLQGGNHADAAGAFQRGLTQLETVPGNAGLKRELTTQLRLALRARTARALHEVADRVRFLYCAEPSPHPGEKSKFPALEASCRAFWEKRHLILERLGDGPESRLEEDIRLDLLDLAIVWTGLRVRLAGEDGAVAARHEALRVLAQAERLFGPNAVLYHERRLHAAALRRADLVREARRGESEHPPRTAWEHYSIGRSLLQAGRLDAAAARFERALAVEPNSLWPNFYQGVCHYQLRRFEDAALAFTVCTTLAPNAACFHNRALAFIGLGRTDRALADLGRALERDPSFADAAFNRGLLHFQAKRFTRAAADLQYALKNGADPVRAHFQLALVCVAREDRAGALSHLKQTRKLDPGHAEAARLIDRLTKSK
jgi:serine/threonine protein kinase/Flp pilus assembly protein TadD